MPLFPYQSISETILNEQNSIEACEKLESTTDFMSLPISIPSLAATYLLPVFKTRNQQNKSVLHLEKVLDL